MSRIFINREKELEFLERKYNSNKKEVIIIYGRRRVGKTELIKEFIKGKDAIYFLADRRGTYLNSKRFMELVSEFFDYPYLEPKNFDDVFRIIAKLAKKRLVVVIDEFSYLLEQDNAIASVFQYIIDEILTEKIMLILCGSLISTMESTFSYRNPLYGRRTGQWKVTPLSYFDFSKSLPSWPIEEKIKLYAVTGGVPFYFMQMDENKTVFENILEKILSKGSILYEEIEFLLREELRDPSTYMSILEAIAFGNTRLSDIANYTKIKINDLPKYLNVLMKMDIIKREQPVTEKIRKTKKSIYLILLIIFLLLLLLYLVLLYQFQLIHHLIHYVDQIILYFLISFTKITKKPKTKRK
ncbi:MAG: AAA family ATPase [Candidatus Asgardarchaeia archaeon]